MEIFALTLESLELGFLRTINTFTMYLLLFHLQNLTQISLTPLHTNEETGSFILVLARVIPSI